MTEADLAAQAAAVFVLRERYPAYLLLSEEGPRDVDITGPAPVWKEESER